jgi:hypothetical protein
MLSMRRRLLIACILASGCREAFDPTDLDPCAYLVASADAVHRVGDHCYSYHSFRDDHYGARDTCTALAAHLVTYTSAEESDAVVAGLSLPGAAWIGLDYSQGFGAWNWVTGEPEPFARWAPGEPAMETDGMGAGQHPDGTWFATSQTGTSQGFICESQAVITYGHIYVADYNLASWDVARESCEQRGGHLATITSAAEQLLIEPMLGGAPLWIGASDLATEGVAAWVTGEPFEFAHWAEFEPDTQRVDDDCVQASTGGWGDRPCAQMFAHLCEIE